MGLSNFLEKNWTGLNSLSKAWAFFKLAEAGNSEFSNQKNIGSIGSLKVSRTLVELEAKFTMRA